MSEKKRINEGHADYPEYVEKCRRLNDEFRAKEAAEKAKYPDWKGLDHPASDAVYGLKKQFHADLRALREEYAHLFAEERDHGE